MKFRPNTMVTLGASAVFGLAAVFLARNWINQSVDAEFQSAQTIAETVKVPLIKTITSPVVVANTELGFGDRLTPESLRLVEYPEDAIPEGAYSSIEDLLNDQPRRVLLSHISQFEAILPHKLSGKGGRRALSQIISEGKRAATFRVNTTSSVGGYILPNDRVDILYVKHISENDNELKKDTIVTQVVFQNMKVLGVDLQSDQQSEKVSSRQSVTLEVTNEEAQKLLLMQDTGSLTLTLRGAGQTEIAPEYTAKLKDVFGKIVLKRPNSGARRSAVNKRPTSNESEVTIIRGDDRSKITVLNDQGPK